MSAFHTHEESDAGRRAPRRAPISPAARRAFAAVGPLAALVLAAACAPDTLPNAPAASRAATEPPGGPALRVTRDAPPPALVTLAAATAAAATAQTAILWHQSGTGNFGLWSMNGTAPVAGDAGGWAPFTVSPGWEVEAAADFDGDGSTDLLLHQTGTGVFGIWRLNGTALLPAGTGWTSFEASPGWNVVDAADFTGDGAPDLLFHNPTAGQQGIWRMNGVTPSTGGTAWTGLPGSPGWRPEAAGDFDVDLDADVLWHQPGTGNFGVWLMSGTTPVAGSGGWFPFTASPGWDALDALDFTGDRKPDLLLRNASTGETGIWAMDGVLPSTLANAWSGIAASPGWVPETALPLAPPTRTFAALAITGSVGWFQCAIATAGPVYCWGNNDGGQLGDNTATSRPSPAPVIGLPSGIARVVQGRYHACALTGAGQLYCWGLNGVGQLGTTTQYGSQNTAIPIPFPSGVTSWSAIAAGSGHTCAIAGTGAAAGKVFCWGNSKSGRLGNDNQDCCYGPNVPHYTPTAAIVPDGVTSFGELAANMEYTCAIASAGVNAGYLYCWGAHAFSGGDCSNYAAECWRPRAASFPAGVTGFRNVVAGDGQLCAFAASGTNAGKLYCWGPNTYGQFGVPPGTPTPAVMPPPDGASPFATVALGHWHACAVPGAGPYVGQVFCAGANPNGELGSAIGYGTDTPNATLTPVGFPAGAGRVTQLVASYSHTCALDTKGIVYCWGSNYLGQIARDPGVTSSYVAAAVVAQ